MEKYSVQVIHVLLVIQVAVSLQTFSLIIVPLGGYILLESF